MFKRNFLILFFILILGFAIRVIFISISPISLYGDELTIALDANSIIQTGRDQLGNFMPLTFPMGAGRPFGYVYGSAPYIAIFGPSALGVRALSILSGIGIIILIYLLGKRFISEKLGLIAAALTAFSPWDIAISRGGYEAHFALFLVLLGTFLFIKAKEKPYLYIFSALSFGLTFHTYPTYKISLLLFLPVLFWFERSLEKRDSKKYFIIAAIIFTLIGLSALSQTFFAGSEKRFSNINIFSQGTLKNTIEQKINLERQISNLPFSISKFFHNKPIEYGKVFIENYLQNFSLDFLVLHGDRNPRHNMGTIGGLYFAQFFLIFAGVTAYWYKERRLVTFLLLWIVLSPLAAAFIDLPHALRSSFMMPPLIILSALGLNMIINYKNKIPVFLMILLFVIQFVFFVQKLFFLSPNGYSNFWSYPAKKASELALEAKDRYNYIIISDRIDDIEFAYPLYADVRANEIIEQNKNKTALSLYKFKKFENVYIGYIPDQEIEDFIRSLNSSVLYIGNPFVKNYITGYELIEGKNKEIILTVKKIP